VEKQVGFDNAECHAFCKNRAFSLRSPFSPTALVHVLRTAHLNAILMRNIKTRHLIWQGV
jgi:hypothetical protein